jgi:hypothetical protein
MLMILVNLRGCEPLVAHLIAGEASASSVTVAKRIHGTCGNDGDRTAGKKPEFHDVQPEMG